MPTPSTCWLHATSDVARNCSQTMWLANQHPSHNTSDVCSMSPVHAVPVVAPPHSARLCQLVPLRGYSMFVNTDLINTKPCQKAVILRDLPHKTHACAPNGIIISMLAMHPCIILTCSTHRIKTPFPCSCRSLKAHCNVRHASNILYLHVGNAYTRPLYACPIKTIWHVQHADYCVMCIS
jgi:hypothetical protein